MKTSDFNDSKTFAFFEVAAFIDFCFIHKLTTENSLVVCNVDRSRTIYFNS